MKSFSTRAVLGAGDKCRPSPQATRVIEIVFDLFRLPSPSETDQENEHAKRFDLLVLTLAAYRLALEEHPRSATIGHTSLPGGRCTRSPITP